MEFEYEPLILTNELQNELRFTVYNSKSQANEILTFDISEQELLAIGLSNKHIEIYNSNQEFITGFSIETYGGSYYVKWENENLWIYTVRNSMGICIQLTNPEDVIIQEVYKIKNNTVNNAVWNQLSTKSIEKHNVNYIMTGIIPYQYDTIVKQTSDGTTTELFSVRTNAFSTIMDTIGAVILWLLLFTVVVILCLDKENLKKYLSERRMQC